jgi:PAS domain S-box-containing protein
LPARVLASGEPAWFENTLHSNPPPARESLTGLLGSAFAFPVSIRGKIVGVAEVLCRARRLFDADLPSLLEAIGLQFGSYLDNYRTREEPSLWPALFERAADAILCVNRAGQITEWNNAAGHLFGYSRSQVIGRPLVDAIVPPRLREQHLRGFTRPRRGGESNAALRLETFAQRADGSEMPVEITIVEISPDDGFVAGVRDLSERYRGKAELEQLMANARAAQAAAETERTLVSEVFANSPYLILVTEGPEHRVRFATDSAVDVFRPRPDVLGQPLGEAYPEFAQLGYVQLFSQVYKHGEAASGREIPLSNKAWKDTVRYFDYTFQPLRDKNGGITGVAAHGTEVTDKVVARQHLEEALHARDDFVSVASHELRNPLNVLQLQIASTALKLKPNVQPIDIDGIRERLGRMSHTVGVLSGLVERLLDVSRIASGPLQLEPEEFELGGLVREVVDRISADGASGETIIAQAEPRHVVWDRQRTDQLIANLLANAYKYAAGQPVNVQLQARDGLERIEVRDRGPGIPAEDQARIFRLFEQVQPRGHGPFGGLGFGLWICRHIVEAHGGRIWVESAPGSGACFIMEIPSRPREESP